MGRFVARQGCNGDVGISESEGETTATKASKRCERSRRTPARRTLPKLCQAAALFFPSIGTRPGNPGIFLNKLILRNWKIREFSARLCSSSVSHVLPTKITAAQELQRVLERGPEGQQDKTGTEVIYADVIQYFTACASRKRHASQCTTIDDII